MRDLEGLHRFLADRQAMPFAWGPRANDCFSFPAAAIVAMGGPDLVDGLEWHDETSAWAALDSVGGVEAAVGGLLPALAPAFAQRGDVGAIAAGNGLILVIVEGDTLAGPGPTGLRRLPRGKLVKAWRAL